MTASTIANSALNKFFFPDPSIQVNSLIIISLVIRHNEITKEIAECIGATQITSKKPKVQRDLHGSGVDN